MNFILLLFSFLTVFFLVMAGYTIAIGSIIWTILTILASFLSMGLGFVVKRKFQNNPPAGSE